MTRGVFFKVPTAYNIMYPILKCIDIEKYDWYSINSQNEVHSEEEEVINYILTSKKYGEQFFFKKDYYDGESFLQEIQLKHLVVFLKLQAYLKHGELKEIDSYEEFLKSDCRILMLIYDCYFVDIYIKDEAVVKAFYDNALANNYAEVKYITDENDGCTGFKLL